jgi:Chaperone of endosialidase
MNTLSQPKNAATLPVLIALTLGCLALAPQTRAVCQEGCLTNNNTVLGDDVLLNNTGTENTAIGFDALFSNTSGFQNTATGSGALFSNTTACCNTATGALALVSNTTGQSNAATGAAALQNNTTGDNNTANGFAALLDNTTGHNNTAHGSLALGHNRIGSDNTAVGANALLLNTGSSNIALGSSAGLNHTSGSNNIYIGNAGSAENAHIRIGTTGTQRATFIAGISGQTVPSGVGVIVGTDGKLGTVVSSARFKEAIKPMDEASEAILALKPVTFHYKKELDADGIRQFGLVAEDVEKVNPDLVARDEQGKPYTVRYEAVNAMLLNEFLKEHRKVEQLEKQVAALTAGLQKVSAQLELSKSAPQTVLSNQ